MAIRSPAASRSNRTHLRSATWLVALAVVVASAAAAAAQTEPVTPRDQEFPLDVDLDDRVDPVRPGDEVVYEVEVENFTSQNAPNVVLTVFLPPGTSFVAARREPSWAQVGAQVQADRVLLSLGSVEPCDLPGRPRCRDIWLTLEIDGAVEPGTLLENRIVVESSDGALYPDNEASTFTTVGSAAVRASKVFVGNPLRDRLTVEADLARTGVRTRDDPPTPTIELSEGLRVMVGEPDEAPILDVTVPAADLRCTNPTGDPDKNQTCGLRDPKAYRAMGLQKLQVLQRPYRTVQRNNAQVRIRGALLDIPAATGNELEVTIEAGGETYTDTYVLEPSSNGRFRRYSHTQGEP